MKKFEVMSDCVMAAPSVVEARDSESAEKKAWRYVHSRKGFEEYVRVAAPNNVLFGKNMDDGDGFDIPCDAEEVGDDWKRRIGCIEITESKPRKPRKPTGELSIVGETEWECDYDRGYFGYKVHIDNGVWTENMGFPAFTHEQMLECKRIQDALDPEDKREEYAHLEYDAERNVWHEQYWNADVTLTPFTVDGIELFALGREMDWVWGEVNDDIADMYRTV